MHEQTVVGLETINNFVKRSLKKFIALQHWSGRNWQSKLLFRTSAIFSEN